MTLPPSPHTQPANTPTYVTPPPTNTVFGLVRPGRCFFEVLLGVPVVGKRRRTCLEVRPVSVFGGSCLAFHCSVEEQKRGRLHGHALLHLEGLSPEVLAACVKDGGREVMARAMALVDSTVQAWLPDEVWGDQRLSGPLSPGCGTAIRRACAPSGAAAAPDGADAVAAPVAAPAAMAAPVAAPAAMAAPVAAPEPMAAPVAAPPVAAPEPMAAPVAAPEPMTAPSGADAAALEPVAPAEMGDEDCAAGWLCTCCCLCCDPSDGLHPRAVGRCHAGCMCCSDAAKAAARGLAWAGCCCTGKGGPCRAHGPRGVPEAAAEVMALRTESEEADRQAAVYRPAQYVTPVLPVFSAADDRDATMVALWSGYMRSGYRVALAAHMHTHSDTCWKYGRLNDPTVTCRMGSVKPASAYTAHRSLRRCVQCDHECPRAQPCVGVCFPSPPLANRYPVQSHNFETHFRQLDPTHKPPRVFARVGPLPEVDPADPAANAMFPFPPGDDRLVVLELRRPGGEGPCGQVSGHPRDGRPPSDDNADVYLVCVTGLCVTVLLAGVGRARELELVALCPTACAVTVVCVLCSNGRWKTRKMGATRD